MAAKKKKSGKPKSEQPVDDRTDTALFAVQPPVDVPTVAETHAPILAKPRKKKKNKSGNVQVDTDSNAPGDTVDVTETAHFAVQPPPQVITVPETHPPILSKPRKKKKNQFNNPEPEDDVKIGEAIDHSGCEHSTHGNDEIFYDVAEARTPSETSPTQSENDRHWGFQDTPNGEAETSPIKVTDAPINLSFLNSAGNDGAGGKGQNGGKQVGYINIARQEALEAVSDFKTRILERAAKKALNDTPFTPSPYPYDLYLYDKPDNTPEDTAMLNLKLRYDAAIIELNPSLVPNTSEIPLNIAKRVARYVTGLLQSHDGQFRCALDGLRTPVEKGQQPLAPWVADTWEERLLDSDRDWLLGKKVDDMTDEKARKHVGDIVEFIHKYKLWGHMVEEECAAMGVTIFPRLN